MTPLYIFDLDGTLALCDHRTPLLADKSDPHRWRKFYAACSGDKPNAPVLETMERLMRSGADVRIYSGRSDEVHHATVNWIYNHLPFIRSDIDGILTMRRAGDFTADDVLKESWLRAMSPEDRKRLVAAFDDRDRVVAMWRRNGVACFQVAPGGF